MGGHDIAVDEAQLLSSLMEGFLYGFSLLMFGATIGVLYTQRSSGPANHRMLVVACLLLLFSTAHFVIDIIRVMQGLILFRDTYPGGPTAFFGDVSQWASICKDYLYMAQTLLGDGVVLYRCYAAWQSKRVMIVPALLWFSVLVTGFGGTYTGSRGDQAGVFDGRLARWITSFYASTLAANLLATSLLAYRIWSIDQTTTRLVGRSRSRLRHVLHVIIDAGAIYSVTLLAGLLCFVNDSNGQYVILDMVTPIISITFYMIIIRVGLASRETSPMTTFPLKWASASNNAGLSANTTSGMQVYATTLTEGKIENYPSSPATQVDPLDGDTRCEGEIKFDIAGEAV